MEVLQIPYSFQRGIWPLNVNIVLPFLIKKMIYFIYKHHSNISYYI
jgi:hypothetical protein